jgi:integrase
MFLWAASEVFIPHAAYAARTTVPGLARGRSNARETQPVRPVSDEHVNATLPHLSRQLRGLVQFQRLTGCRPSEACLVRGCDVDMTGPAWWYKPATHKNAWRGRDRLIPLGPKVQAAVAEFLSDDPAAYLFSPAAGRSEWYAQVRSRRKTKVQPSQVCRKKHRPKKRPGLHYTARSYAAAVAKACKKGGVPHWHPNQLRHSHATMIRRQFGLEAAQVALGHARANVTQVYAERDQTLALKIAREVG